MDSPSGTFGSARRATAGQAADGSANAPQNEQRQPMMVAVMRVPSAGQLGTSGVP
jgi:hypothetical protein